MHDLVDRRDTGIDDHFVADRNGRYVHVNPAAESLLGRESCWWISSS